LKNDKKPLFSDEFLDELAKDINEENTKLQDEEMNKENLTDTKR